MKELIYTAGIVLTAAVLIITVKTMPVIILIAWCFVFAGLYFM